MCVCGLTQTFRNLGIMTGAAWTRCMAGRHAMRCIVLSWKPSAVARRRQKTAAGCIAVIELVFAQNGAPRFLRFLSSIPGCVNWTPVSFYSGRVADPYHLALSRGFSAKRPGV